MGTGFALCLLAWPLFALAMDKHQPQLLARGLPQAARRSLRVLAWVLLVLALAVFLGAKGAGQGPVFWGASLVLSAIAWVLLLTFAARSALALAAASALGLLVFA